MPFIEFNRTTQQFETVPDDCPSLSPPPIVRIQKRYKVVSMRRWFKAGQNQEEYEIPFDRISNASDLLGWIAHIAEKGWCTAEHIRQLIEAAETLGVKVNHDA